MAWQRRGNREYFYLSRRKCGRVVTTYEPGPIGAAWSRILASRRRERAIERQALESSREWGRELEAAARPLLKAVHEFASAVMIAAGYHRCDRSRWRRRRTMARDLNVKPPRDLDALLERASRGDETCYDEVMALFEDDELGTTLIALLFNIANMAKNRLVNQVAGKNYAMAHAMIEGMNVEAHILAGKDPTPIEQVLAERIALCKFVVWRCELRAASLQGATMPQIEHEHRLLDRAHRRLMQALETLARVRRLALPVLVRQINVAAGAPLQVVNEAESKAD
jgi:hypothetical protein